MRRLRGIAVEQTPAQTAAVVALTVLLAVAASAVSWHGVLPLEAPAATVLLPWWALTAAFAVTELSTRNVQVGRHSSTQSLSEVPLVLGLFFAEPTVVVASRLLGSAAAFVLRRHAPVKLAFNGAVYAAHTSAVVAGFHALAGQSPSLDPLSWAAAAACLVAGAVVNRGLVLWVVQLHEGWQPWTATARAALLYGVVALPPVVVGLVAACALAGEPRSSVLVAAALAALLLVHNRMGRLEDEHARVRTLFGFSQQLAGVQTVDAVTATVCEQARTLLRAERSVVLLTPGAGPAGTALHVSRGAGAEELAGSLSRDEAVHHVVAEGGSLCAPRDTRDPGLRRLLEEHGLREAVVVPLQGDGGTAGALLVADRSGNLGTFDEDDRQLLGMLAGQAGLALGKSQVLDRLQHEARHDALTGLANRAALATDLERFCRDPEGGCRGAVLLLDLDGFKQVNDTLGHAAGDALLQVVAARLSSTLRVGATVARLGGDEFAVVLEGVDHHEALLVAVRLDRALREPVVVGGQQVEVGASLGVALAPEHGRTPEELLRHADAAMYEAKAGGGGVRLHHPVPPAAGGQAEPETAGPSRGVEAAAARR